VRSKFLAFFRENPVLLLVAAALAFFLLFWNPKNRIELSHDPESWFDKQPKIELQFGGSRIHLHSNGNWEVKTPPVMSMDALYPYVVEMPKRGVGIWRVRGSELFLDGQSNDLGGPINLSGIRLSDQGGHLQLVPPNGKTQQLTPAGD
jgi:hypothetical protein